MIYTIANVTVTTAGTPVPLAASRVACGWVAVTALLGNSGTDIYLGGANPASKKSTLVSSSGKVGILLAKGVTYTFTAQSAVTYIDLQDIWVDADTSNDAVSVTYGLR